MTDQPERRLEPGHRLDRYELLCPIAQGGMASVWLARQHGKHGFEKLVAVKTILPSYAQDLRFQQMFLDEARIASGIEHANVAQILDLGEENDVLYLAMEWVDGDSLSKLFRAAERAGKSLPISIVCRVIADTCAGLHAAHELRDETGELLNVVHRDISPQNLLLSTKGQAKLIDFGIAKARDRVSENTSAGLLKGKILYMAPEQALGRPVDRRADVWAIGAVLYHMLAGVPPLEGSNQLATLHMLINDDPIPALPAHIPPQVVEVVRCALVRDVASRIPTAEALQRKLERAMVESGHTAIQADVASFVAEQLKDRVDARRKAVQLALEAAKHRQKLQQMLEPAGSESSSGLGAPLRTRLSAMSAGQTVHTPSGDFPPADLPSSATLGSAAVVPPRPSLSPSGRKMVIAGSVLAGGAVVVAMLAATILVRGSVSSQAAQPTLASPPPPPVTAVTPAPSASATPSAAPEVAAPTPTLRQARPKPVTTAKPASTGPAQRTKPVDDGF